jgi:hypothetical protein
MGCWFYLAIDALFDGEWVEIIRMFGSSRCGGFPLARAMWSLVEVQGVGGTYGSEYKYAKQYPVLWKDDSGLEPEPEDKPEETDERPEDQKNETDEEPEITDTIAVDDFPCAHYSREVCGPEEDPYPQRTYLFLMPEWMDLARYAYPYKDKLYEFYPSDHSTGKEGKWSILPNILKKQREIRQGKLTRMVTIALSPCLNECLCKHIVEYALPVATDVRFNLWDDEGQAEGMRKGGIRPSGDCVIM